MRKKSTLFELEGVSVPVQIIRERRRNVRAAIGRRGAILRLPAMMAEGEAERHLRWFGEWLSGQVRNRPVLLDPFRPRIYRSGDRLAVGARTYALWVEEVDRASHAGRMSGDVIHLRLSKSGPAEARQAAVRQLLSRLVAKDQLPAVRERTEFLNARYFGFTLCNISLKYKHTSWGSCSGKGNITLSTRLLFAPQEVIDYVIIHELAHLSEMNHSPRFWALVATAMPGYQACRKWLKQHGATCDF